MGLVDKIDQGFGNGLDFIGNEAIIALPFAGQHFVEIGLDGWPGSITIRAGMGAIRRDHNADSGGTVHHDRPPPI